MAKKAKKSTKQETTVQKSRTNKTIELASFMVLTVFLCGLFIWSTFYVPRSRVVLVKEPVVIDADFIFNEDPIEQQEEINQEDLIADLIEDLIIVEDFYQEPTPTLEQEISTLVDNGVSFNFKPQVYSSVYELYEEELPYDIYDGEQVDGSGLAGIDIEIVKKPAYFGEVPVIAVVIDDMGISPQRTGDINSLKAPITSSFLTYGHSLSKQIQASLDAGHEVIVHVPMEAKSKVDVAPDVLTVDMNREEIISNLSKMLKPFNNIKGVNNHMGSKFTENIDSMNYVMEYLKDNDMFFLDSKTSSLSKGKEASANFNVDYAARNVFLDNNNNYNYIMDQLKQTENIARKNGYAVAIGHPKSQTYLALKDWIPSLEEKGFRLVKLTEIVNVLNPKHEE